MSKLLFVTLSILLPASQSYIAPLVQKLPTDIRAVRKSLGIDSDVILRSVCPTCHCLWEPLDEQNGSTEWRSVCTYRRFSSSSACNSRLTKSVVREGRRVEIPIKTFAYRDFDSFVGRLLCTPGLEAAIMRSRQHMRELPKGELHNITHAKVLQDFLGPDKRRFRDEPENETRLTWIFSGDSYNPYHNKPAGKVASNGVLILVCADLPPSLRYKKENMFVFAIIPNPEPPGEAINHYLYPLIKPFVDSWQRPKTYSKTYHHTKTRKVRNALVCAVCDLVGARKFAGQASHSSNKHFCSKCLLSKTDIKNTDPATWTYRTASDARKYAEAHRDAPSKEVADDIFHETGWRWSVFWLLPYWNPLVMVVVDPMHNLFLGLVKHHFRVLLGADVAKGVTHVRASEGAIAALAADLDRIGSSGATIASRHKMPAIIDLCLLRGLYPYYSGGKVKQKDVLIGELLVSIRLNHE